MTDEIIVDILELGPFFVNCYIVGDPDSKEGIIIDPSAESAKIISHVDRYGLDISRIIITHGHADHIGALDEIRKYYRVPVFIGRGDAHMLTDWRANLSGMSEQQISTDPPEETLQEGDIVNVGHFEFQVFETPGHSPGSISLYGHGMVFTGDALFLGSIGRTDFPGCSHEILIKSIREKLLILPDETIVYAGHGPDSTIGQEREYNPFL